MRLTKENILDLINGQIKITKETNENLDILVTVNMIMLAKLINIQNEILKELKE